MWGGNMMGWGGGWGGGGGFFGLFWLALLIVGVVVLVRWLLRRDTLGAGQSEGRALSILKERYARGEIDKAEFDARKRDIS